MKVSEQKLARRRLDVEMRSYRRAGMEKRPTSARLRVMRQALRIHAPAIAARIGRS